jgi:protein-tyrosine phosphatase
MIPPLQQEDVQQKIIATKDFLPPSHDLLDQGADWIVDALQKKGKVYVHCKSGIGRSASMVVAYLVKYRGMPANAAATFVREKRPAIFSALSPQMKNLVLYEEKLKQQSVTQPLKSV